MSFTQHNLTKLGFMKTGTGAGLIAGFGLFSSFFGIDQWLDLPVGTFYKTIGLTMGLDQLSACLLYTSDAADE